MRKTSHPSCVIWFTGLPASGKTTLADGLNVLLKNRDLKVERLDGDQIRSLFPQTGFSQKERDEHIHRMGFLASRLEAHGVIVIASFISPYQEARNNARKLCQHFIEIYLNTPLEVCMKRDPKGLYQKAKAGQITQMTGVTDPYEAPVKPELTIDTSKLNIEESLQKIMNYVDQHLT